MHCVSAYSVDTNLERLGTAELFALMAMRLWVGAYKDGSSQDVHWWEGFLTMGIDRQSAAAFDIFMQILFYSSKHSLDVRDQRNRQIGGDEVLFLRFISSMQHHQYSRALEILEGWLSEEEAGLAWEPAMQMVAGLTSVKLILPLCEGDLVSVARLFRCAGPAQNVALERWSDVQRWLH